MTHYIIYLFVICLPSLECKLCKIWQRFGLLCFLLYPREPKQCVAHSKHPMYVEGISEWLLHSKEPEVLKRWLSLCLWTRNRGWCCCQKARRLSRISRVVIKEQRNKIDQLEPLIRDNLNIKENKITYWYKLSLWKAMSSVHQKEKNIKSSNASCNTKGIYLNCCYWFNM